MKKRIEEMSDYADYEYEQEHGFPPPKGVPRILGALFKSKTPKSNPGLENKEKLVRICSTIIKSAEQSGGKDLSCESEILPVLNRKFNAALEELSRWNEKTDYIYIAHAHIAQTAFDLLASGRYHIYRGTLDPLSCASNLRRVYDACMKYAVDNGKITEEQMKDEYEYLAQCIAQAG